MLVQNCAHIISCAVEVTACQDLRSPNRQHVTSKAHAFMFTYHVTYQKPKMRNLSRSLWRCRANVPYQNRTHPNFLLGPKVCKNKLVVLFGQWPFRNFYTKRMRLFDEHFIHWKICIPLFSDRTKAKIIRFSVYYHISPLEKRFTVLEIVCIRDRYIHVIFGTML